MNINKLIGGLDNGVRTRNEPNAAEAKPNKQAENASAAVTDQVNLSAGSKTIQQVEAEIRSMPEVDDATVERIRTAIESGQYKVDYEKLAGKMLNFEDNLK